MKILYGLSLFLLVSGCGSTIEPSIIRQSVEKISIAPAQRIFLQLEFQDGVRFLGEYDNDSVGLDSGNMVYPGDAGVAGFLAAILTHAAISGSVKDNAYSKVQEEANKVLLPYSKYLQGFKNEELFSSIIGKINDKHKFRIEKYDGSNNELSDFVLKSEPIFYMSQDQKELILKHAMTIHRVNQPDKIIYKNITEIASNRINNDNMFNFWIEQNNLPIISADLYAESIDLLFFDMKNDFEKHQVQSQKTYRFMRGGKKSYERGTFVKSKCGYTVIRTLRGWLKSFPDDANISPENKQGCNNNSYVDHKLLVNLSNLQ